MDAKVEEVIKLTLTKEEALELFQAIDEDENDTALLVHDELDEFTN